MIKMVMTVMIIMIMLKIIILVMVMRIIMIILIMIIMRIIMMLMIKVIVMAFIPSKIGRSSECAPRCSVLGRSPERASGDPLQSRESGACSVRTL